LRGRHEGEAAFRFLPEQAKVRRRVTDAGNAQPARIGPARADAAADEAACNRSQGLSIEVAQVDDVEKQGDGSA
jgi:hypothetical protein